MKRTKSRRASKTIGVTLPQASLTTSLLNAIRLGRLAGLDVPEPTLEHMFHGARKWRFDAAWIEQKVAVECDGGVHTHGRHTRGAGFIEDCVKLNAAVRMGWRVLRYTGDCLNGRTMQVAEEIAAVLKAKVGT